MNIQGSGFHFSLQIFCIVIHFSKRFLLFFFLMMMLNVPENINSLLKQTNSNLNHNKTPPKENERLEPFSTISFRVRFTVSLLVHRKYHIFNENLRKTDLLKVSVIKYEFGIYHQLQVVPRPVKTKTFINKTSAFFQSVATYRHSERFHFLSVCRDIPAFRALSLSSFLFQRIDISTMFSFFLLLFSLLIYSC